MINAERKIIFSRYEIIALFCSIFFLFSFLAFLNISFFKREFYLDKCGKVAWVKRIFPAGRGSIYDKNGVLLTWTERKFDLVFSSENICEDDRQKILSCLKEKISFQESEDKILIKRNLDPEEIMFVSELQKKIPGKIEIKNRFTRVVVDYPGVKEIIGEMPDGKNPGSGAEKTFDSKLRGQDGVLVVMLDRRREPILQSMIWLKKYKKGEDIKLDIALDEIKGKEN